MQLQINLPFCTWDYRIIGVYRITFEDGSFYIGSSNHLKQRANQWELIMKKGIPRKDIGTQVMNKILALNSAVLEIVELCYEKELRDKEAFYLDKYKDDVNMVSNSDIGSWKSVLQYKIDGTFIKKHFSMSGAARYNEFRLSAVQKVLYGERKSHGGMVFIFEKDYHQRRKEIVRSRYKNPEKRNGREVLLIDDFGNVLESFKTLRAAGHRSKCSPNGIARAISGHQRTAGGFKWKYSETA